MRSAKEHLEAEENVVENDLVQITLRHVLFGFPLIFAIKDVDAIDPPFNNSFIIKVGSGSNTLFWKDQWCCSGNRLMDIFPRFYALDTFKDCKTGDSSGLFKVKTLTKRIEKILLFDSMLGDHHTWNMWIPRKVSVSTWRASLNRLPTRSNLACRSIALPSSCCPFCNIKEEVLEPSGAQGLEEDMDL
ncbi:RNA-directed DNA polymerase, eukaryota, reverse transcriptase zinc-binding domain protein [Tanacetum coccineum]